MTQPDILIGIDPGVTGAVAFLTPDGRSLDTYPLPSAKVSVGKGSRTRLLEAAAADLIGARVKAGFTAVAAIERVSALPKQGVASTFTFGLATGFVRGVAAALDIPLHELTPQAWRALVGLPRVSQGKGDSRAHVMKLYPEAAAQFTKAGDHNKADAALIAHALRLRLQGGGG